MTGLDRRRRIGSVAPWGAVRLPPKYSYRAPKSPRWPRHGTTGRWRKQASRGSCHRYRRARTVHGTGAPGDTAHHRQVRGRRLPHPRHFGQQLCRRFVVKRCASAHRPSLGWPHGESAYPARRRTARCVEKTVVYRTARRSTQGQVLVAG